MGGCSSVAGERLRMVAGRWCFHIAEDSISAAGQSESEIPLRNAAGNIRDDIKVFCTLLEPIELLDIFSSAGDTAVAGLWLSKIMGFFSGFFTGFALTTSVLYLTIQTHKSNRLDQSNTIRDQARTLNWLGTSVGAYDRRFTSKDLGRRTEHETSQRPAGQTTTKELLKHRWNKEVEVLVKKAHESRWEDVRGAAVDGWNVAVKFVKRE